MAANGLLDKIFGGDHIACGCRPQLSLCGIYSPKVQGVVLTADSVQQAPRWCHDCLVVWEQWGCGNCDCGSQQLCDICEAAVPSATHQP